MRFLLILTLALLSLTAISQVKDTSSNVFSNPIEKMPKFPGGEKGLWCFLENNFNLNILNKDKTRIRYYLKFRIDSSGIAKDFSFIGTKPVTIKTSHSDSLKRVEILRVFNMMPRWEPAVQYNGQKTSVWFSFLIKTPYSYFRCKKKI